MKIRAKLILVILIFVLLPSLIIGSIAYTQAKESIGLQTKSTHELAKKEVQVQAEVHKHVVDTMHSFAGKNIDTNIHVAQERFRQRCGSYAIAEGQSLVCETGLVLNDQEYEDSLVQEIKNITKGEASIFSKQDDGTAMKISTTEKEGMYAYGYIMEPPMYEKVMIRGESFKKFTKIKGIFETKNCMTILNSEGSPSGALCTGIWEMDVADELINHLESEEFGTNGQFYVLSDMKDVNEGEYVAHKEKRGENGIYFEYIKNIIKEKVGVTEYEINGQLKVAAYTYFEPYNWIIVAEQDMVDNTKSIAQIRNTILITVLIILFLGLISGYLITNKIVGPITKISEASKRIAAGEIGQDLPEIRTNDEIRDLSDSIGLLVGALKFLKKEKKK